MLMAGIVSSSRPTGFNFPVSGNSYATTPEWNPDDEINMLSFTVGNKQTQMGTTGNNSGVRSFAIPREGKVYFEVEILSTAASNGTPHFGIRRMDEVENVGAPATVEGTHYYKHPNGTKDGPTTVTGLTPGLGANSVGTTWQIAIDWNTGKWWMGRNNIWQGDGSTGDPANGTNSLDAKMPLGDFEWAAHVEIHSVWGGNSMRIVTTLADLEYTPPTGFLSWDDAGGFDAFYDNVVLLVRSVDATDGQITFTDESIVGRTLTRNGDTVYSDTQTKFDGDPTMLFDGSGNDWIQMPDAADLGLEDRTVDFCLEAWIYVTDATLNNGIMVGRDASSSEEFSFYTKANVGGSPAGLIGLQMVIWNPNTVIGVDDIMTTNEWHHVAVTRIENGGNGDMTLYVDGVSVATITQTSNGATNTGVYYIGHNAFNSTRDFTGHIDSLRLTRNNVRYTGTIGSPPEGVFTPPTKPFPAA